MLNILCEPRNALVKQYQKLFKMDGVDLMFDKDALMAIVDKAKQLGTGARGLRSVMESTMLNIMFTMHQHPSIGGCTVTARTVQDGSEPVYKERKASA